MSNVPIQRHKLTVDDYYKMGEVGIFTEKQRVELIEGEILDMVPIGSHHSYTLDNLNRFFTKQATEDLSVRIQQPLRLDQLNEPLPDLTLVQRKNYAMQHPGPQDTLLVLEVADSSLLYDRNIKASLYAQHLIAEYWIMDVKNKQVIVHLQPENNNYTNINTYTTQILTPIAAPSISIDCGKIWE